MVFGAASLSRAEDHDVVVCMARAGDDSGVTPWDQPRQGHRADLGIPSRFIQEPKSPGRARVRLVHQLAVSPCFWRVRLTSEG